MRGGGWKAVAGLVVLAGAFGLSGCDQTKPRGHHREAGTIDAMVDRGAEVVVLYDSEGNAVSVAKYRELRKTMHVKTTMVRAKDGVETELRVSLLPAANMPRGASDEHIGQSPAARQLREKGISDIQILDAEGWMISGAEFERQAAAGGKPSVTVKGQDGKQSAILRLEQTPVEYFRKL
jgi:hypothetical protein